MNLNYADAGKALALERERACWATYFNPIVYGDPEPLRLPRPEVLGRRRKGLDRLICVAT